MLKIIILKGLPASGKSTWAKSEIKAHPATYKRVNKDSLRKMLDADTFTSKNEKFIDRLRDEIITRSLHSGVSVIVDDTNINPKHELKIREIAKAFHESTGTMIEVIVKEFDTPVTTCIKRDADRENSVGKVVIKRMQSQWIKHNKNKVFSDVLWSATPEYKWNDVWDASNAELLPGAWIFDMDGTMSLLNGRNPYDASTCDEDIANLPVVYLLKAIMYQNPSDVVIIVTGRDGVHKQKTLDWLEYFDVKYEEFFIRAPGDDRKDSVIKKEIYENHIKGKYHVHGIFDDRPQVRRMWIDEGLFVFSCYQDKGFMEF